MADRIKFINQKRKALEGQLTTLDAASTQSTLDKTNATLRLARLKELFHAYEELNDELAITDPKNEDLTHMTDITDRFYDVAARITNMPSPGGSANNSSVIAGEPMGSSTFVERQRQLKLPVAKLPRFKGECDGWISFKHAFQTMVDARTDIDNLVKFLYLRDALEGEALNKIAIFNATAENYQNAWKSLLDAYDRRRILIAKHMDAIIDTKPLEVVDARNLAKLVDDTRQRITVLTSMNATPEEKIIVRILERALPISIREKWEESLELDSFPTLEEFYKFINATVFRLTTMEMENARINTERGIKRPGEKMLNASKKSKVETSFRTLLTPTLTKKCVRCNNPHPLYRCPEYNKFDLNEKWKFVKEKHLCYNCLRNHGGSCNAGKCKRCDQMHHTSLHRDERSNPEASHG